MVTVAMAAVPNAGTRKRTPGQAGITTETVAKTGQGESPKTPGFAPYSGRTTVRQRVACPLSDQPIALYARLSKNSARSLSITSVLFSKRTGNGLVASAVAQRSAKCFSPSAVTSAMSQFVRALYWWASLID